MAVREVSEEQFLAMSNVVGTVQKMLQHPEARQLVLKGQKLVDPNIVIPELDNPSDKHITELKAEFQAFKKSVEDEKAAKEADAKVKEFTSRWNADKEKVRRKHSYTDEGIEKIEKLCQERGIADFEAGAALFEKLNPPVEPINYGETRFSMFQPPADTDKYMKDLFDSHGDSSSALRGLVEDTLTQVRRGG